MTTKDLIYVVYKYEENGAEQTMVSTKPYYVKEMVRKLLDERVYRHKDETVQKRAADAVASNQAGRYDLDDGWGGIVLEIVEEF